jgi:predicted Zn-ribbon and HTH transcriptional regulator
MLPKRKRVSKAQNIERALNVEMSVRQQSPYSQIDSVAKDARRARLKFLFDPPTVTKLGFGNFEQC